MKYLLRWLMRIASSNTTVTHRIVADIEGRCRHHVFFVHFGKCNLAEHGTGIPVLSIVVSEIDFLQGA